MAGNLTAIIRADTSGFATQVKKAKEMINSFTAEMKQSGNSVSGVTREQVQAYNRVVNGLQKVENGTKTAKQAQNELKRDIEKLTQVWKSLSNEAKNSDFGRSVAESMRTARAELKKTQIQAEKTASAVGKSGSKGKSKGFDVSGVTGAMADLGMKGGETLNTVASMGKALVNPYTAAAAAVAGVTYAIVDFNNTASEQTNRVAELTGLHGQNATALRNEIVSISDVYEQDFGEVLTATNSLAKQMGISFEEASQKIALGFASGANANGEFLDMVKEYPAYFKEAGISADGFIAIMQKSVKEGVFGDKGVDAIKEANLRLREMPQATQDALNAIGLSSSKISQELANGSTTTFKVMQKVSKKLKELPESSAAVGQAIADIFGGPGEDAGLKYLQMLGDIEQSEDAVRAKMTEQERATYDLQKAEADLQNALTSLFGVSEGGWQTMVTQLKADVAKHLANTINKFIDLYNKSVTVRGAIQGIMFAFKALWEVGIAYCKSQGDALADLAYALDALLKGDFEGAKNHVANIGKDIVNNFGKAFDNIEDEYNKMLDEINNGQIKHIEYTEDTSTDSGNGSGKGKGKGAVSDKKKKPTGLAKLEKEAKDLQDKLKNLPIDADPTEIKKKLAELNDKILKQRVKLGFDVDGKSLQDKINKIVANIDPITLKVENDKGSTSVGEGPDIGSVSSFQSAMSAAYLEIGKIQEETADDRIAKLQKLLDAEDAYREKLLEEKETLEANGETGTAAYAQIKEEYDDSTKRTKKYSKEVKKEVKQKTEDEKAQEALNKKMQKFKDAASAVGAVGSAFSQLGEAIQSPELNVAGVIAQALANVALAYADASKQAEETEGPWAWIAFAATGLATMMSMVAGIKQATSSYAQGGIIQGNSTVGDMNVARVNGGEMILNGTQQQRLFNLLNSGGGYGEDTSIAASTVKVRGSDIYLALKNYNKKSVNNKTL